MEPSKLTNMHIDILKEIGNIGAGNAATSMAQLIDKQVHMDVPIVNIVNFDEMMDIVGGPEQLIVGMFFEITGDLSGSVFFMLSIEESEKLIQQMVNDPSINLQGETVDPLAFSALKESANIITGAYLTALSDFLKLDIRPSIPHLAIDMAGAILTVGLVELSRVSDYAIVINTEINDATIDGITGHFFLLPEPQSLEKIFTSLGIYHDA
ncbi:MAG TPA: chemotaxis protein CheC [Bacillota bacterium]|nr:chemotaxis protein CheC [Bacillota bacterium]